MTMAVAPAAKGSGASPGGARATNAAAAIPTGNGKTKNCAAVSRKPRRPIPMEHEVLPRLAWSMIDRLKVG